MRHARNTSWYFIQISCRKKMRILNTQHERGLFMEFQKIRIYPNFALSISFPLLYQQFYNGDLRYCVLQILFILIFCMVSFCILAVRKCRQLFAKIMLYTGFSVYYKCVFQKAIIDYQLLTCWIYSKIGQFFIDRGKVGLWEFVAHWWTFLTKKHSWTFMAHWWSFCTNLFFYRY